MSDISYLKKLPKQSRDYDELLRQVLNIGQNACLVGVFQYGSKPNATFYITTRARFSQFATSNMHDGLSNVTFYADPHYFNGVRSE